MAEPPSLAGAVQVRLIWVVPLAAATRAVGAPGAVVPAVVPSTLEGKPVPLRVMAETR